MKILRKESITVSNDGHISFKCTSKLYGATDASGKAEDALATGYIPLGDGCDYLLNKFDIKIIKRKLDEVTSNV